jgi:aldehyde dehydrogenase (NAD+)
VAKRFVEDLIACIKRQWGEQPTGSEEMGKIINDFHVKRLTNLLDTSGGQVVYGGRVNAEARHIQPTLILNPKEDSPIMNEEIFGPILPIFIYKNLEEVLTLINDRPKPLAIYYYGAPTHPDSVRIWNSTSSGAYMTNDCCMQSVSHY